MNHPPRGSACPRCRRATASPFAAAGVCLRCAGERVLALESADFRFPPPDTPPANTAGARGRAPSAAVLPDRIGPYEIIEELGRGGMGFIYAARQVGLGRIVALKVLPPDAAAGGLDLRFLREAQTVARMHHPHIVSVFDCGRADGYVYFSMEYLRDGDLGRRVRRRPLGPSEAAALIEKVAGAVAAAHAEGVLHRDIKTSNILLDGDEPKLADFGLASQLEPGGDLTAVSGVLGTPHYLPPEALRGGSAALTVASDLYALGVVLYECLTGRTPFAGASPGELAALVLNSEPPSPRLLAPAVPRDLETICLTCLEKEPGRRYRNAAALAADLHRFREGLPIHARPPGLWDRWRRLARRHRVAAAMGLGAALILVAATGVSTILALRASRAERRAAAEAAAATALANFLKQDLLAQADPGEQPDRTITLHAVVDRAAGRIDARFPAQPRLQAELHGVVGQVYDSLGDFALARAHFEKRWTLLRQALGERNPETLVAMHELTGVLFDLGDLPGAQALGEQTLRRRREVLGADDGASLETANVLAMILRERGRLAEADAIATDALARARRVLPANHPQRITALRSLGAIRLAEFKDADAEALLKEAADLQVAKAGPDDLVSLTALSDLATVYRQEGRLAAAVPLYQRVLDARRRILGPGHPHTIQSMNNLAAVYRSLGRLPESETLQVAAVEAGTRALGRDHPQVLIMLGNLTETYRLEHKLPEAIAVGEETLALNRRVQGERHPNTISAAGRLADLHLQRGELAAAETLLRAAVANAADAPIPGWKRASLRSQLGLVLARAGKRAEAEPLLTESLAALEADRTIPANSQKVVVAARERWAEFQGRPSRP